MYNIKNVIQLNIELEGLLRVLEQRDNAEARDLLAEKFNQYSQAMKQLLQTTVQMPEPMEAAAESEVLVCAPAPAVTEAPARTEPLNNVTVADAAADSARAIKLDEALSARQASDLNKAFTLNDKYRFRRELFAASDSDFSHTIGLIAKMNSYEEARDYLLGDLCWNSDSETVDDFLTIIKRHFQV